MAELVVVVNKLCYLQNTLVVMLYNSNCCQRCAFSICKPLGILFFHYISEIVKARIAAFFKIMRKEALVLAFYLLI